jgi:hypothetical protein
VVNFTPWPLYPRGKTTVPFEEEVGRAPGHFGKEKNIFPLLGIGTQMVQRVFKSLI